MDSHEFGPDLCPTWVEHWHITLGHTLSQDTHSSIFQLGDSKHTARMSQWLWRVQVTNYSVSKERWPWVTVHSYWTCVSFLKHFVKASPWICCRRSTLWQNTNWIRRFQLMRTLFIIHLTKSLDSCLRVSFKLEQNILARADVHILRAGITGLSPSSVVRLWAGNLYWKVTLKLITAKTPRPIPNVGMNPSRICKGNLQYLSNTLQYVLSVWAKTLQSLLFLILRINGEILQAWKMNIFPSIKSGWGIQEAYFLPGILGRKMLIHLFCFLLAISTSLVFLLSVWDRLDQKLLKRVALWLRRDRSLHFQVSCVHFDPGY